MGYHARFASSLYLSLFFLFYDIDDASGSEDQPLIRLIFAARGVAHLLTCADRLMSDSDDGDNELPPPLGTDNEDDEDDASVAHKYTSKDDIDSDEDEDAPSSPIFLKRRPVDHRRVTGILAETSTGATGAAVAGIGRLPQKTHTHKTIQKETFSKKP